ALLDEGIEVRQPRLDRLVAGLRGDLDLLDRIEGLAADGAHVQHVAKRLAGLVALGGGSRGSQGADSGGGQPFTSRQVCRHGAASDCLVFAEGFGVRRGSPLWYCSSFSSSRERKRRKMGKRRFSPHSKSRSPQTP